MSSRLLSGIATLATTLLVSCYPYPEAPYAGGPPPFRGPYGPPAPLVQPPPPTVVVSPQQREIERQREAARQASRAAAQTTPGETTESGPRQTPPTPRETPAPKPEATKPIYPVAIKVVGREGYVISPYNKKQIDVSPFAPGTLVRDPTYPEEEKKFFRVP
jgi:hypothetical protein